MPGLSTVVESPTQSLDHAVRAGDRQSFGGAPQRAWQCQPSTKRAPAGPAAATGTAAAPESGPPAGLPAKAPELWVPRALQTPQDVSCMAVALTLTVALAASQQGSVPAGLTHLISPIRAHYDELRLLGRGGFGQVALVRSRLDHRLLAVKHVRFSSPLPPWAPPQLLEEQHNKLLREVRALAALSWSPHVVRYVTAWVEPNWVRLGSLLATQARRHPALAQLLHQAQQAPHGPSPGYCDPPPASSAQATAPHSTAAGSAPFHCANAATHAAGVPHANRSATPEYALAWAASWWLQQQHLPLHSPDLAAKTATPAPRAAGAPYTAWGPCAPLNGVAASPSPTITLLASDTSSMAGGDSTAASRHKVGGAGAGGLRSCAVLQEEDGEEDGEGEDCCSAEYSDEQQQEEEEQEQQEEEERSSYSAVRRPLPRVPRPRHDPPKAQEQARSDCQPGVEPTGEQSWWTPAMMLHSATMSHVPRATHAGRHARSALPVSKSDGVHGMAPGERDWRQENDWQHDAGGRGGSRCAGVEQSSRPQPFSSPCCRIEELDENGNVVLAAAVTTASLTDVRGSSGSGTSSGSSGSSTSSGSSHADGRSESGSGSGCHAGSGRWSSSSACSSGTARSSGGTRSSTSTSTAASSDDSSSEDGTSRPGMWATHSAPHHRQSFGRRGAQASQGHGWSGAGRAADTKEDSSTMAHDSAFTFALSSSMGDGDATSPLPDGDSSPATSPLRPGPCIAGSITRAGIGNDAAGMSPCMAIVPVPSPTRPSSFQQLQHLLNLPDVSSVCQVHGPRSATSHATPAPGAPPHDCLGAPGGAASPQPPSRAAAAGRAAVRAAGGAPPSGGKCELLGTQSGLSCWPYELLIAMEPVPGLTLDRWLAQRNQWWAHNLSIEPSPARQQSRQCQPDREGGNSVGVGSGGVCAEEGGEGLADESSRLLALGPLEKQVFVQLVQGLAHVHAAGIIHRDVKPANIFVVPKASAATSSSPGAWHTHHPGQAEPSLARTHSTATHRLTPLPAMQPPIVAAPVATLLDRSLGAAACLTAGGSGSPAGDRGAPAAGNASGLAGSHAFAPSAGDDLGRSASGCGGGGDGWPSCSAFSTRLRPLGAVGGPPAGVLVKIGDFGLSAFTDPQGLRMEEGFGAESVSGIVPGARDGMPGVVYEAAGRQEQVGGALRPTVSIHTATTSRSHMSTLTGSSSALSPVSSLASTSSSSSFSSSGQSGFHRVVSEVPAPAAVGGSGGQDALAQTPGATGPGGSARLFSEPPSASPAGSGEAATAGRAGTRGRCHPASDTLRTSNIGTASYAAPEQQAGPGTYGTAVDIYPLGLILLELAAPFATGMERAMALQDARHRGRLPAPLGAWLPHEAALIRSMLSPDPALRPTCWQLLAALELAWGGGAATGPAARLDAQRHWLRAPQPRRRAATAAGLADTSADPGGQEGEAGPDWRMPAAFMAGSTSSSRPPRFLGRDGLLLALHTSPSPPLELGGGGTRSASTTADIKPAVVSASPHQAPVELQDTATQTEPGHPVDIRRDVHPAGSEPGGVLLYEYRGQRLTGRQLLELLLQRDAELAERERAV